jgi:hypothetical protein
MPEVSNENAPAAQVCKHRWLLEAPVGELTQGRCRLCGASREFAERWRTGSYNSRLPRGR